MHALVAENGVQVAHTVLREDIRQLQIGKGSGHRPHAHREMGEIEDIVRELGGQPANQLVRACIRQACRRDQNRHILRREGPEPDNLYPVKCRARLTDVIRQTCRSQNGTAPLGPAEHPGLLPRPRQPQASRSAKGIDGVAALRGGDGILMLTAPAQALIIRRDDNVAFLDQLTQRRHAKVGPGGAADDEIFVQVLRRVEHLRRAAILGCSRRPMRPSHNRPPVLRCRTRRGHEQGRGDGRFFADIRRDEGNPPGFGPRHGCGDGLLRDHLAQLALDRQLCHSLIKRGQIRLCQGRASAEGHHQGKAGGLEDFHNQTPEFCRTLGKVREKVQCDPDARGEPRAPSSWQTSPPRLWHRAGERAPDARRDPSLHGGRQTGGQLFPCRPEA